MENYWPVQAMTRRWVLFKDSGLGSNFVIISDQCALLSRLKSPPVF